MRALGLLGHKLTQIIAFVFLLKEGLSAGISKSTSCQLALLQDVNSRSGRGATAMQQVKLLCHL